MDYLPRRNWLEQSQAANAALDLDETTRRSSIFMDVYTGKIMKKSM
jgi:hypothetical protein